MSAVPHSPAERMRLFTMQLYDLPEVMDIEIDIYPFPWTEGNFSDSLRSGYAARVLREPDGRLAGYFLLMPAVDEVHLLNISVRRELQGRGLGRHLLDYVVNEARQLGMESVLLEVRPSNTRALSVYEAYGFVVIGRRKGYYPAGEQGREDAIVMRLVL